MLQNKKIKESDVLKSIMNFLKLQKHYVLRLNSGKVFNEKSVIMLCPRGTPDILAVIKGRAVFLEVKRDSKTVKTWWRKVDLFQKTARINGCNQREVNQYKAGQAIDKAGGVYSVVSSVKEVKKIIDLLKKGE